MTDTAPSSPRPQHYPRRRSLLSAEDTQLVTGLAQQLLLVGGILKPDTFLTDHSGNIRLRNSKRGTHWEALNDIYLANRDSIHPLSDADMLKSFATQSPLDDVFLFREKAQFINRVLEMARAGGQPLIDRGMAHRIHDLVPPHRSQLDIHETPATFCDLPPRKFYRQPVDDYRTKVDAIKRLKEKREFYPSEFLRYVLIDRDGKRFQSAKIIADFEDKIECARGYLSSNVFSHHHRLSIPLQEKLAALSHKDETDQYFWDKPMFSSDDAKGVILDMDNVDLTAINKRWKMARSSSIRTDATGLPSR